MVTDGAVTAEGNRIHYREGGSGPTVVLLHGGIIDAAHVSWPPVIDRLTPDYRVVAPDLLGYGESEVPPGSYSIQRHAAVVAGVLDELDLGPVTLVGVSVGGGVAMQVALDRPDLVARLVPIDSYGLGRELPNGLLSYALARVQLGNEIAVAAFRRSRRLTRASLGGIVHDLDSLPAAAVDAVYREVQRPTAGVAFRRFRDAEVTRGGYRTTFTDRFTEFSVPTHVLHGAHDDLFPVAWARRAVDRIPGAELTVLGDCAHWAPRENPAAVAEHVESAISAG
ncbi:alpha/beta hydrolase [Haloarcula sp. S1CR25-12]|uniref:Alpha/beta hydrolase n=1 Tax=Haloarcula saliterrae TaxID=2950534 RepID=A0ABU2FE12_9EURY|nr:alpha/beta hydrolase [Haloarcula sp. S1CR25-12]MDS0259956.1 alpha/beta hydrolase [Haloarcula sp. S1CR25-12]